MISDFFFAASLRIVAPLLARRRRARKRLGVDDCSGNIFLKMFEILHIRIDDI
jgi:hypothetical protein